METQGERRDRQRELRALETIASALALPLLRERADVHDLDRRRRERLRAAIRRHEAAVGIPEAEES